jgi:hypothetical protein
MGMFTLAKVGLWACTPRNICTPSRYCHFTDFAVCLQLILDVVFPGIAPVYFLDLNEEVLAATTAPNVVVNCMSSAGGNAASKLSNAKFMSGDWDDASRLLTVRAPQEQQPSLLQFRMILTAETIYTQEVTLKLCKTLRKHLR